MLILFVLGVGDCLTDLEKCNFVFIRPLLFYLLCLNAIAHVLYRRNINFTTQLLEFQR